MRFVTDKTLHGRNFLHVNYCPATCSLKNQLLLLWADRLRQVAKMNRQKVRNVADSLHVEYDRMYKHILKHHNLLVYAKYCCGFSCTVVVQHSRQERHRAKSSIITRPIFAGVVLSGSGS